MIESNILGERIDSLELFDGIRERGWEGKWVEKLTMIEEFKKLLSESLLCTSMLCRFSRKSLARNLWTLKKSFESNLEDF